MSLEVDNIISAVPENFAVFSDSRDRLLATAPELPPSVDLSQFDSPVQLQTVGSCTADACTNLFENLLNQKGVEYFVDLSRLFLYWFSRRYLGWQNVDAGSSNRMTIRTLANIGACTEREFPYDSSFASVEPASGQIAAAAKYKIAEYFSIRSPQEMMNALAQGFPVVFATTVMGGAHAMLAVGYDLSAKTFKCKNSYGPEWGDKGYINLTHEQMSTMFDAWTFRIDTTNMPKDEWLASPVGRFLNKIWLWITTWVF